MSLLVEPSCLIGHTIIQFTLTDEAKGETLRCSTCNASPVVARCPECATDPTIDFCLCAKCFETGREVFKFEAFPQGNYHPYAEQYWTGRFYLNTKQKTRCEMVDYPDMLVCPALDFTCDIFNKSQVVLGATCFAPPSTGAFEKIRFVLSLTSGTDERLGESNRIGFNGGGFGDNVDWASPVFGWLNSDHYIEGEGTYKITRSRIQDLIPNMSPRELTVKRIEGILKERCIETFALMTACNAGSEAEEGKMDIDIEKKRAIMADPSKLPSPTLNLPRYSSRVAKEKKEFSIKSMFRRYGSDWLEYKFGQNKSSVRIELEDLVYGVRMMLTSYLTTESPITKNLSMKMVQAFVDPRWEILEKKVKSGASITASEVPEDLEKKFYEYFYLRFILTFFHQRKGHPECFGMTRPLGGPNNNALKMVEVEPLPGAEDAIVVGNVEVFVAQGWWSRGDICISFQGTTDARDSDTNFDGKLVKFTPFEDASDAKLKPIENSKVPGVHSGYYKSFLLVKDRIAELVGKMLERAEEASGGNIPNCRITVTGHSMGGALAAMTTVFLAEWLEKEEPSRKFPKNIRIMCQTYGQPKLANSAFVQKYERHPYFSRVGSMSRVIGKNLNVGDEVLIVDSTSSDKNWKVILPGAPNEEISVPSDAIEFVTKTKNRPKARILRMFDLNDVVPTLPPQSLGFVHIVGDSVLIDAHGNLVFVPARLSKRFDSTSAGVFRAFLNRMNGMNWMHNHIAVSYIYKVVRFMANQAGDDINALEVAFQDKEYASRAMYNLQDFF